VSRPNVRCQVGGGGRPVVKLIMAWKTSCTTIPMMPSSRDVSSVICNTEV